MGEFFKRALSGYSHKTALYTFYFLKNSMSWKITSLSFVWVSISVYNESWKSVFIMVSRKAFWKFNVKWGKILHIFLDNLSKGSEEM